MAGDAWVVFESAADGDMVVNGTLAGRIEDAAKFSAVTSLGFFTAFLVAWVLSWPRSNCLLECCCGVVGCECSLGDTCCEDDDDDGGGGGEAGGGGGHGGAGGEEGTFLLGPQASAHVRETAFNNVSEQPRAPPKYLYPVSTPAGAHGAIMGASGQHAGQLGIFMIMVEFLDAIPEAAVVAIGVMDTTVEWSLVASIFMLNITSGLATFTDLIENSSRRQAHLLFLSATVAAGMLVFSVSNDIYSRFQDQYKRHEQHDLQLETLLGGTIVGALLVLFLMWLHNSALAARIRRKIASCLCFLCDRKQRLSYSPAKAGGAGCRGAWMSLALVLALMAWTVSLCMLFVLLFDLLYESWNEADKGAGIAFIEGLSGGAFIVTIGGTLIPFSQLGAQGVSNWGRTRKAFIAAIAFTGGLLAGEVLSTLV